MVSKPPGTIDGASVLRWAWSGSEPFGYVQTEEGEVVAEIYGFAICLYAGSSKVYRFACNAGWMTEQDGVYDTVQDAIDNLPMRYRNVPAVWNAYVPNT